MTFSKLRFSKFKKLVFRWVFGSFDSSKYYSIFKLLIATLKSEVREQTCAWFFYYFNFERNYDVLKSKSPRFLLNKNIDFIKNRELKVKLWWVWISETKKNAFFIFILLYVKKILLHTLFCLFLKLSTAFSVSLKQQISCPNRVTFSISTVIWSNSNKLSWQVSQKRTKDIWMSDHLMILFIFYYLSNILIFIIFYWFKTKAYFIFCHQFFMELSRVRAKKKTKKHISR